MPISVHCIRDLYRHHGHALQSSKQWRHGRSTRSFTRPGYRQTWRRRGTRKAFISAVRSPCTSHANTGADATVIGRQTRTLLDGLPSLTEQDLRKSGQHGMYATLSWSTIHYKAVSDSMCPICFTPFLALLSEEETAIAMDSPAHPIEELGVTKLQRCGHVYCRKEWAIVTSVFIMAGHWTRNPFYSIRKWVEGGVRFLFLYPSQHSDTILLSVIPVHCAVENLWRTTRQASQKQHQKRR